MFVWATFSPALGFRWESEWWPPPLWGRLPRVSRAWAPIWASWWRSWGSSVAPSAAWASSWCWTGAGGAAAKEGTTVSRMQLWQHVYVCVEGTEKEGGSVFVFRWANKKNTLTQRALTTQEVSLRHKRGWAGVMERETMGTRWSLLEGNITGLEAFCVWSCGWLCLCCLSSTSAAVPSSKLCQNRLTLLHHFGPALKNTA